MQAVFDFSEMPVSWTKSIYPNFDCFGRLEIPWRWINSGREEIGEWLIYVRQCLENGDRVDLRAELPRHVTFDRVDINDFSNEKRLYTFYKHSRNCDSVVAILPGRAKHKVNSLARQLGGKFSAIEEVEGRDLFSFIRELSQAGTVPEKLICALEFSKKCMGRVSKVLSAATRRGEVSKISKSTRYPDLIMKANAFCNNPSSKNLHSFLVTLRDNPETTIYKNI